MEADKKKQPTKDAFGSSITFIYSAEVERAIKTIRQCPDVVAEEADGLRNSPDIAFTPRQASADGDLNNVHIPKIQEIYADALLVNRKAIENLTNKPDGELLEIKDTTDSRDVGQKAKKPDSMGKPKVQIKLPATKT